MKHEPPEVDKEVARKLKSTKHGIAYVPSAAAVRRKMKVLGVMPMAMMSRWIVFNTIAQYSTKKPRTGLRQFSGEFLLGSSEWASALST